MQGPEPYLLDMRASFPCAVHPDRRAVIDVAHRVSVNWETYYTSDESSRTEFLRTPYRFTGLVTDPVSRDRFVPSEASPRRDRDERIFYFASLLTVTRFDENPGEYATPAPTMVEMGN